MPFCEAKKTIYGIVDDSNFPYRLQEASRYAGSGVSWPKIIQELDAKGLKLTKEDIFESNILFDSDVMKNDIGTIMTALQKNGEYITTDEWKNTQYEVLNVILNTSKTEVLIKYAMAENAVRKIFAPELWIGRGLERSALWECLYTDSKTQIPPMTPQQKEALFGVDDKNNGPVLIPPPIPPESINKEQVLKRIPPSNRTALEINYSPEARVRIIAALLKKGDPLTAREIEESDLTRVLASTDIQLWNAAYNGNVDLVQPSVGLGFLNLEYAPMDGTALWNAAKRGHPMVLKHLAEAGADIETVHRGRKPLEVAVIQGNESVVVALIALLEEKYASDPDKLHEVLTSENADGTDLATQAMINRVEKPNSNDIKYPIKEHICNALKQVSLQGGLKAIQRELQKDTPSLHRILECLSGVAEGTQTCLDKIVEMSRQSPPALPEKCNGLVEYFLSLDETQLTENHSGLSAIGVLTKLGKLRELFTMEKWSGNPTGMNLVATRVPTVEKARQFAGLPLEETLEDISNRVAISGVKGFKLGVKVAPPESHSR